MLTPRLALYEHAFPPSRLPAYPPSSPLPPRVRHELLHRLGIQNVVGHQPAFPGHADSVLDIPNTGYVVSIRPNGDGHPLVAGLAHGSPVEIEPAGIGVDF